MPNMAHTSKTSPGGCTPLTRHRVNDNPVITARDSGKEGGEESYS